MKAPQLFAGRGLTLLQAQRWAATLTAFFAFLACAVSGELGLAMLLLFPLAAIGAERYGEKAYGRADWAWTLFLAGALLVFGWQVLADHLDIVLAAAQFVELLCIHRLWHRRTQRDELLLMLLSLLQLCSGAALAAELNFGFSFLAFAVAATWAMALTHLRFEIEGGRGPQGSAALLRSRRIATPALLGALAALAMMALAGAAIVFFTFPRVTIGGLRRPSTTMPTAGLGDRIDLSQHGTIADDPRVVLRARFTPSPGVQDLDMHWRARALPVWTGQGWRAAEAGAVPRAVLPPRRHRGQGKPAILQADLEAVTGFSDGVVLTPEGWPLSVRFQRPLSARGAPQQLLRNASGDLFYQPVEVGDVRYIVVVDRNEPSRAELRGRGKQYPDWLFPELGVPKDLDPRVAALAKQIAGDKDPVDAAAAIERWLWTRMRYTRELPGETRDPIAHFLFERRLGHCELFSSAMVLMLRSLGIPARNVTGYYGGHLSDAGYYAVRAGDAHSWVEVFFPGAGWIVFDPTPATGRGSQQEGLWARLVLLWDGLQQRWRMLVVDYDLVSQEQALQWIGHALGQAGQKLSGKPGGAPPVRMALLVGCAVALAGLLLMRIRGARLRLASFRRGSGLGPDQRRAIRLWRRARIRLQRAGIPVTPATTPREAAERARIPAVTELADEYGKSRWGGKPLPAGRARRLLRNLDATIRSGA